jgi:hypothetical protein
MPKKSGRKAGPKRAAGKAAPNKRPSVKAVTQPQASSHPAPPRRLKLPKYKLSFKNRVKHPVKLPSAWQLARQSALTLRQYQKLFIGITLIYGLLDIILAQSLSGATDVSSLRQTLGQVSKGHVDVIASGLKGFGSLIGSAATNSDPTAGTYQLFLGLVVSLALIWALRQVLTGKVPRIRDAYYRGMTPLIPFILVLLTVGLQLMPLLIGSVLYGLVMNNGIAIYFVEKLVWLLIFVVLAIISLYLVSSSLFALYIVTLPDMTPMKALRSARELVRHRRWTVLRKILCLPIMLLVIAAIIMVPIIVWLTPLSKWVFFLLSISALTVVHTYMYTLYRELLNE